MQYIHILGISDASSSKHGCGLAKPALWGLGGELESHCGEHSGRRFSGTPRHHPENDDETWVRARANDNCDILM